MWNPPYLYVQLKKNISKDDGSIYKTKNLLILNIFLKNFSLSSSDMESSIRDAEKDIEINCISGQNIHFFNT